MKKAFTLLELVIVIVILGILATLGYTQYNKIVEKMRISEAITNLGKMRTLAIAYYMQNGAFDAITNADVGVGTDSSLIPYACVSTNYFSYNSWFSTSNTVSLLATRCTGGGKTPNWGGHLYAIQDQFSMATGACIGTWDYVTSTWSSGTACGGINPPSQ